MKVNILKNIQKETTKKSRKIPIKKIGTINKIYTLIFGFNVRKYKFCFFFLHRAKVV